MATKAKPAKAKPSKKLAKAKQKDNGGLTREEFMESLRGNVEARYKLAMSAYNAQDAQTKEVIDRINERLRLSATGLFQLGDKVIKIEKELIDKNTLFTATEVVADLALNGVKVANFQFDQQHCAECKGELSKPKKKKTKK